MSNVPIQTRIVIFLKQRHPGRDNKLFVLAGSEGIISAFVIYQGKNTFLSLKGSRMELTKQELDMGVGASVVIALVKFTP